MNTNQSATMYESVPVVSELNKVQGFDPLKFLRRTTKGEKVLDLKYKKLWFRLKYPNGRIKLSSLKITDQLAIIEARVYFDKNDAQPRSSFIAQRGESHSGRSVYRVSAARCHRPGIIGRRFWRTVFCCRSYSERRESGRNRQRAADSSGNRHGGASFHRSAGYGCRSGDRGNQRACAGTPVVQETVAEAPAAEVMESAAPAMEDAEGEEIEEETADTDTAAPTYSSDMPVDEICSMMTYEEAGNVIVPLGTCKGWAMSQVADRRPASLKWYINGYSGNDNILRAAATIMQASLDEMQRAS